MPWLAAGIIGSSVIGGIAGAISNSSAQDRANMLQNQAIQQWLKINIPDPAQQQLALQQFVVAGKLTPQLESAIKQDPTAFQKVVQDQGLKQAQLRALSSLEDLGTGQETYQNKAAQQTDLINEAAQARGNQQAITSSMAQRGQLGTGLELQAKMDQGQADQNTMAQNAMTLEGQRRTNALQAIQDAGSQANQMSQQNLDLQEQTAKAADAINNFNTVNSQNVSNTNVANANNAQQFNIENAQDVSNKNTTENNYQQQYNKELAQQQFEDESKVAAGISGADQSASQQAVASGANAANFWGSIAGNAPKVATAVAPLLQTKTSPSTNSYFTGADNQDQYGNLA